MKENYNDRCQAKVTLITTEGQWDVFSGGSRQEVVRRKGLLVQLTSTVITFFQFRLWRHRLLEQWDSSGTPRKRNVFRWKSLPEDWCLSCLSTSCSEIAVCVWITVQINPITRLNPIYSGSHIRDNTDGIRSAWSSAIREETNLPDITRVASNSEISTEYIQTI
jgi:hypothetical protein